MGIDQNKKRALIDQINATKNKRLRFLLLQRYYRLYTKKL